MLSDESPKFSYKDVGLIVSFTAVGALAYANLLQVQQTDRDATKHRFEVVEAKVQALQLAALPDRINRIEYILCATDDTVRTKACAQMGVSN